MKRKYYVNDVKQEKNIATPFYERKFIRNLQNNYLRALQIFVILLTIGVTEGGIRYLYEAGVEWRDGESLLMVMDVNRAVLWLAMVSTCAVLKLLLERPVERGTVGRKAALELSVCGTCGRNRAQFYVDAGAILRARARRKRRIRKFDVLDFVHSGLFALLFLNSAALMIGNIPHTYNCSLEVYLKVVGVAFDLVLVLLFTRTCADTYERNLSGVSECRCAAATLVDDVTRDVAPRPEEYEPLPGSRDNATAANAMIVVVRDGHVVIDIEDVDDVRARSGEVVITIEPEEN